MNFPGKLVLLFLLLKIYSFSCYADHENNNGMVIFYSDLLNVEVSSPHQNDSTSVIFIYSIPQVMKIKIKGEVFKLSERKKEIEMLIENVPAGVYNYRFIIEYQVFKGSFILPANDTLVIVANYENFGDDPVIFAKMQEVREAGKKLKREKEIRDSILVINKKKYMEGVIQNEVGLEPGIYEPTDEEIFAKSHIPDSAYDENYDELFYIVEEMPTFNQGDPSSEFKKYIARNITFEDDDCVHQLKEKLTVVSHFIVGSDGYVRDVEIITPNVPPCLQEMVIDLFYGSPRWMPGFQRGRPVNVMINFPIAFIPPG